MSLLPMHASLLSLYYQQSTSMLLTAVNMVEYPDHYTHQQKQDLISLARSLYASQTSPMSSSSSRPTTNEAASITREASASTNMRSEEKMNVIAGDYTSG